jgi:hypothetical protein
LIDYFHIERIIVIGALRYLEIGADVVDENEMVSQSLPIREQ